MFIRLFLALICIGAVAVNAGTARSINVTATDDLGIAATYYPVESNNAPAVVLLHSLGKNRDEWSGIAPALQRNGIAALAIDLRGHGESKRRLTADGPQLVDYHSFKPQDYQDMLMDINAAFDWLAEQPGINKQRIGIVGANLGANLALRYSAFNEDIAAILVFSPGLIIQDVRTDTIITKIGKRPLHIAVASEDRGSLLSSKRLLELRKKAGQAVEENELTVCTGNLQGTAIVTGTKGMPVVVFGWLDRALQGLLVPPP
ncbi:MAG: alpha/beta fold hydrolase [Verrucomicrobiota bacterium]